jgi:hypothetical protein
MSILTGGLGLLLLLIAIGGALALDSPQLTEARADGRRIWYVAVGGTTLVVGLSALATYVRLRG